MPPPQQASSPTPSVSVALCTHNGAAFIAGQVRSILEQSPAPLELVVGDDDSDDGTLERLQRAVDDVRRARPGLRTEVVITRRAPALGVVGNFEATIAACRGDVIALSDQDDVWHPGRLAQLVQVLEHDPSLLLVHSDARLVDADGAPLGGSLLDALEITDAERAALTGGDAFSALLRRNLVTGATIAFRRELLHAARPFPPEWVHDEWLAAMAAAVGGLRLIPEALTDYRQHGANQIGARRLSVFEKLARLREPRDERAARLERRAAQLVERLETLRREGRVAQRRVDEARAKLDHESRRARLPGARMARVPAVLAGAAAGRYGRYSRGAIDVLRDLVQPPSGTRTSE